MKILNRYIFFECLIFFLLSLFAFTGILFTIQLLRFSNLIINRGVALGQIGLVFASLIPTFLEFALPMSTLLGIMLGFARLSGDSEIVVLRSSGVSLYQLTKPVIGFAIVIGLFGLFVSLRLKPWGFRTLSATLFEIAKSRSTAGLDEGVFNRLGDLTLYSEKIDYDSGELQRVVIDDRRSESERKVIFSKKGQILSDDVNHTVNIYLRDGEIHEQAKGKYSLTHFVDNKVSIAPDDLYGDKASADLPPRALYLDELKRSIARFKNVVAILETRPDIQRDRIVSDTPKENLPEILHAPDLSPMTPNDVRKKYKRLQLERGLRFSMPFSAVILAFIAMPLGIQPPRTHKTWGATFSFLLGLFVFLLYYGILSIGITLSDSGKVNPILVCWLPNIAMALAAAFAVFSVASERVQSISQFFEPVVAAVSRKFKTA